MSGATPSLMFNGQLQNPKKFFPMQLNPQMGPQSSPEKKIQYVLPSYMYHAVTSGTCTVGIDEKTRQILRNLAFMEIYALPDMELKVKVAKTQRDRLERLLKRLVRLEESCGFPKLTGGWNYRLISSKLLQEHHLMYSLSGGGVLYKRSRPQLWKQEKKRARVFKGSGFKVDSKGKRLSAKSRIKVPQRIVQEKSPGAFSGHVWSPGPTPAPAPSNSNRTRTASPNLIDRLIDRLPSASPGSLPRLPSLSPGTLARLQQNYAQLGYPTMPLNGPIRRSPTRLNNTNELTRDQMELLRSVASGSKASGSKRTSPVNGHMFDSPISGGRKKTPSSGSRRTNNNFTEKTLENILDTLNFDLQSMV